MQQLHRSSTAQFESKKNDYKAGIFLARTISFIGWLIVLVPPLAFAAIALGGVSNDIMRFVATLPYVAAVAIACIFLGLIMIASGHMMRATMDTANATRQMLRIMQTEAASKVPLAPHGSPRRL